MKRRAFLCGSIATALAAPVPAAGQRAATMSRVRVLARAAPRADWHRDPQTAFFEALRDLGWIEGHNLAIEHRYSEERDERLPALASELVRAKVDVIVAAGGPATLTAARGATNTVPIVMVASSRDPIGAGLIQSYARPGGNITGLATAPEELTGKQF